MGVQCVLPTFTPENDLKINSYTEHCSVAVLHGLSIFIDVRIKAVLDVTRVSERLMVVRVIAVDLGVCQWWKKMSFWSYWEK
jgi:hypothetical protein